MNSAGCCFTVYSATTSPRKTNVGYALVHNEAITTKSSSGSSLFIALHAGDDIRSVGAS